MQEPKILEVHASLAATYLEQVLTLFAQAGFDLKTTKTHETELLFHGTHSDTTAQITL